MAKMFTRGVVVIMAVAALLGAGCASNSALEKTRQEQEQARVQQDLQGSIRALQADLLTTRTDLLMAQRDITDLKEDLGSRDQSGGWAKLDAGIGSSTVYVPYDGMNLLQFPVCTAQGPKNRCPADKSMYGRIGWFTEWPEMQWCVNRRIGPTGSEQATLDNEKFNAQCVGLLGEEDEAFLVNTGLATMTEPGSSSAVRVHRYGVSFGADYWVERSVEAPDQSSPGFVWGISDGLVARLDKQGLHILGNDSSIMMEGNDSFVQASYLVARVQQRPYNAFAIQDENGVVQWMFRLEADNSLVIRDAEGVAALTLTQEGQ